MHKSLFTKSFWLAAAENLYYGATAETANVVHALAMQNSTLSKRGVHADKFQCKIEVICADAVEHAHTKSLDANDKLRQTRPHVVMLKSYDALIFYIFVTIET